MEKFVKEEEMINADPEIDKLNAKWNVREAEEMNKLERILKKERTDFENLKNSGSTNFKPVFERVSRTIKNARTLNQTFKEVEADAETKHALANE